MLRRLQVAKLRIRTRLVQDGVAQRSAQLVENRGAPQEPLNILRQLHQRLAVQVVGHVPIITGDRRHVASAVPRDQRGQVKADRPSFGPGGHRRRLLMRDVYVGFREDLLRARHVEGQVGGRDLHRIARSPQPRQVGLLGATRRDQLRTLQGSPRSPR